MEYAFFCIHARNPDANSRELNRFCANRRVVGVDKQFVQDGENSFWAICINWLPATAPEVSSPKGRIDYREILNEQDFDWFARLRQLRKDLAARHGVSVFQVFTNRQLADMVTGRIQNKRELAELDGVGAERLRLYGAEMLALLNTFLVCSI